MPLGVRLANGAVLLVDGKADVMNFSFSRCEAWGCLVETATDTGKLQAFRRAEKASLTVLDGQGRPFVLPLSFKGFGVAVDAMDTRNRAWGSEQKKNAKADPAKNAPQPQKNKEK